MLGTCWLLALASGTCALLALTSRQGPAPAGMGDGFEMPLRHEFRAKEATYVASRDVCLPEILLCMATS